ncbi:MAG TPA: ATP-binding protein [Steroidobacteraceae bacterium]|nr:ATP-binding protein [Steroidobacteraceae bacterium]
MKIWRQVGMRSLATSAQWAQIPATILFAGTVTVLLLLGVRDAGRLAGASSALQLATQLSERPDLVTAQLTLIQRGLETTTYVGGSLRALSSLREGTSNSLQALRAALSRAGLLADPAITASLSSAGLRWQSLDQSLSGLADQRGAELYIDAPSGSALSASGKAMKAVVDGTLFAGAQDLQQMSAEMSRLAAILRGAVNDSGLRLRALLIGGSALAALMLGLMLFYAWRSRLAQGAAAQAERRVTDILRTVREGLFLVDRQLRLSPTYSDSLRELLHLPEPAGLSFEKVLASLADAKTVSAAVKYLGLLWKDKVHEDLIESVNPLGEIEVAFANPHGGTEVRHLAFSFRRVRSVRAAGDYILGVVADVTDRVLLARELESLRSEGDSQATLQLQLLRTEPESLQAFLWSTDVALRESNAALTAPGIEQEDLRKKLNAVFRELHTVKGEATALNLDSFVQRIHAIEAMLSTLRQRSTLSGNDFLPVVVRLDELIGHLGQARSMYERIGPAQLPNRTSPGATEADDAARPAAVRPLPLASARTPGNARGQLLADTLRTLALHEARAQQRSVRLLTRGLAQIPPEYAQMLKEICIQMVRNAIAHGIEPSFQRVQLGKPQEGTLQINFAVNDAGQYTLTIEDDGYGLNYEQIVDRALRLDLLRPQQLLTLDWDNVWQFILQPGFSTADDVSEHAGRGVGLDVVNTRVREARGTIEVATAAGKYTRFSILLPPPSSASAASVA